MSVGSVLLIGGAFLLMGIAQAVTDFVLDEWRERRRNKRVGRGMTAGRAIYDEAMRMDK